MVFTFITLAIAAFLFALGQIPWAIGLLFLGGIFAYIENTPGYKAIKNKAIVIVTNCFKAMPYTSVILMWVGVFFMWGQIPWAIGFVFLSGIFAYIENTPGYKAIKNKHQPKWFQSFLDWNSSETIADWQTKLNEQNQKLENLLEGETIVFQQAATYREGLKNSTKLAGTGGTAFILSSSFVFTGSLRPLTCKLPFNRIIDAKLDYFQIGGVRSVLASGNVGRQLQQTLNTLAITYLDDENIERTAKFQINGAITIYGEAEKAREFLSHLLDYKSSFIGIANTSATSTNTIAKIQKLKTLLDQGLITQEEFDQRKQKLLDEI